MDSKLVIYGASGHALVVADIIRLNGDYSIVGFVDDVNPQPRPFLTGGATVLGGADKLNELRSAGVATLILAFGDCQARLRLAELLQSKGFCFATAVHPGAIVADGVQVAEGTIIAAGAVVAPKASIGRHVIVNTAATVDHECIVEDGVHLSPGVHLGGLVSVEKGAWVGIGAIVLDRVRIGRGSIIGGGTVVTKDVPPEVVVYGVPGRIVRTTEEQRKRLKSRTVLHE